MLKILNLTTTIATTNIALERKYWTKNFVHFTSCIYFCLNHKIDKQ